MLWTFKKYAQCEETNPLKEDKCSELQKKASDASKKSWILKHQRQLAGNIFYKDVCAWMQRHERKQKKVEQDQEKEKLVRHSKE